ncbi:adenylate cyclase type 1-like [Vicugna pacos]|uniref:Adenylate cyclase type 1-like n=1 Tax=Vicugna pacos TaxID=30538 RepID=A0ABM5CYY2_VICPA
MIPIRAISCIFTVVCIYSVAPGYVGQLGADPGHPAVLTCAGPDAWHVDVKLRPDYVWAAQAEEERDDTERVKPDNRRVLFNLLPAHVALHCLMANPRNAVRPCVSSRLGALAAFPVEALGVPDEIDYRSCDDFVLRAGTWPQAVPSLGPAHPSRTRPGSWWPRPSA